MASVQEPEVQFAQRLASNEKPIRTKALKKLRKYINVRSQKEGGGFTSDELLKLWKGLFYCLWMQDKPLLQEELSNQIANLIHSFHHVDGQILFLESFLQTFKREWTGIDRLRMDKFFQLIRFMFRQAFELLKKKNWEESMVSKFLEMLTAQLLQSGCEAPSGLQFHILDLYMTELAAVGSAELTADQNLMFIEPFCKTAAKTKDHTLFGAICSSIFSAIIDQAPFAILDLMKETEAQGSDSDSGQASEEDEEEEKAKKPKPKPVSKKGKQINGKKSKDDEDDDDDDDLLHLDDSDTEMMDDDEGIGPVLQFNYRAVADKLFALASRGSTPNMNRKRLYKIIRVLRDLSEGVFPKDQYPEEVSTDEDDDDFGSRKRMKRQWLEGKEEEAPAAKKKKGKKKEAPKAKQQNKEMAKDDSKAADVTESDGKKKKKRKKKKRKKAGQVVSAESGENTKSSEETEAVAQAANEATEGGKTEDSKETGAQSSVSSVKVTETSEGQTETVLLSEVKKQPTVTVSEETSQPTPNHEGQPEKSAVSEKKKKKKGLKSQSNEAATEAESKTETPETGTKTPAKTTKEKDLKPEEDVKKTESQINHAGAEADSPEASCTDLVENGVTDSTTPAKRKKKKKLQATDVDEEKVEAKAEETEQQADAEISPQEQTVVPTKKKTKKRSKLEETTTEAAGDSCATPLKKKQKNVPKESEAVEEKEGAVQVLNTETLLSEPPPKKKKKKTVAAAAAPIDDIKDSLQSQVDGSGDEELPLRESEELSSGKAAKKKKRKIPVVFEFEADELEAAASINGQEEESGGSDEGGQAALLPSKKSQKTPKGQASSDFVTFQRNAAVPTPLFCKTKGGFSTPPSSNKKNQSPKSESKKVTFGLKNNKTAEFRKTDRSLLVSPDGSSRVPFDPEQKPKFGVLKSPPTPLSSKVKKTPAASKKTPIRNKKTPTSTKKTPVSNDPPKSTPRRRPSAADFF